MTSFERIQAAINHKESDHVPFDLGGTTLTGINKYAYFKLRKYLNLDTPKTIEEIVIDDKMQQLAYVEDDLRKMLRCDVRSVMPDISNKSPHLIDDHIDNNNIKFTDEWGIGWRMPLEGGHYFDMYKAPMEHIDSIDELKKWKWNDPEDPTRFNEMANKANYIVNSEKCAYLLGRQFAGIFETALWLRGIDNFLCDLYQNPEMAEYLLDVLVEMKIKYWNKALEAVGENVMLITEADDLGTQDSMMISPEMYRKFLKPRHQKIHAFIKNKAKRPVKIFFHCCGSIYNIIPDLIESHIDILNPYQVNAKNMDDTKMFKKEFGKEMTIWGGGCDTQRILNLGSRQQVIDETKKRIDDLAPGGGFVFTPVHNIQGEVPPENIMAMWETWDIYGKY